MLIQSIPKNIAATRIVLVYQRYFFLFLFVITLVSCHSSEKNPATSVKNFMSAMAEGKAFVAKKFTTDSSASLVDALKFLMEQAKKNSKAAAIDFSKFTIGNTSYKTDSAWVEVLSAQQGAMPVRFTLVKDMGVWKIVLTDKLLMTFFQGAEPTLPSSESEQSLEEEMRALDDIQPIFVDSL